MLVLRNTRFLARQGLPLRGDGEEPSSNIVQLLCLQSEECKDINVNALLEERTKKYTSLKCRMNACKLWLSECVVA